MTLARYVGSGRIGAKLVLAAILVGLSACSTTPASERCAFVELEHLARPFDGPGMTLICSLMRVSAAYRDLYFPGYVWGDETWTVRR